MKNFIMKYEIFAVETELKSKWSIVLEKMLTQDLENYSPDNLRLSAINHFSKKLFTSEASL